MSTGQTSYAELRLNHGTTDLGWDPSELAELGLLRSVGPLRTPSNAARTHEEQQLGFRKWLGFKRQKVDVNCIESIGITLNRF